MKQIRIIALTLAVSSLAASGCAGIRTAKAAAAARKAAAAAPTPTAVVATNQMPEEPKFDFQSMTAASFAQSVAASNLLDIKLAQVALTKSSSPDVEQFARRMGPHYEAIQVIITKIAAKEKITLPTRIDAAGQAVERSLAPLDGEAFDSSYITVMALNHKRTLAMYRWAYEDCGDPELKSFAAQTLPMITLHSKLADQMDDDLRAKLAKIAEEEAKAQAVRKVAATPPIPAS